MPIILPSDPDGNQYEDFVTAGLNILGYFVEPRITLREEKKEILELDVVATPLGGSAAERVLFEVKKDRFSFSNVFKLFGQRTYLGIGSGVLVSMRGTDADYLSVYEAKGKDMAVKVCHVPVDTLPVASLAPQKNKLTNEQQKTAAIAAWYSNIGRTFAHSALLTECKTRTGTTALDNSRTYIFNTRASFFLAEPLERAEALYSAYIANPGLAGEAVKLIAAETKQPLETIWNSTRDDGDHLWVQSILDAEHHGRFSIIKHAYDDFVKRGALPPPQTVLKIGSLSLNVPLHALPASFQKGLSAIASHPHAAKIPYLLQVYYRILGGFIFYKDQQELEMVEALTGIPVTDVVPSLRLLDIFFPANNGFFFTAKDELLCLKMVPAFVRGGGAFFRNKVFGITNYSARYPNMGWLLVKWHNALYRTLEPHLKKEQKPA